MFFVVVVLLISGLFFGGGGGVVSLIVVVVFGAIRKENRDGIFIISLVSNTNGWPFKKYLFICNFCDLKKKN